ncbi:MAG TPA: MBL fold metallo-hydrolase, partial [Chloroflexota bacterium]|nr:MBL fold metallo-hydrolase [Chloroflexota bacterium]
DTGPPGTVWRLLAAMTQAGVQPRDLRRIVLTHCDVDHIANAHPLQRVTGAEVCAHEDDLPYITGAQPLPGPPARRVIGATIGRLVRPPRVDRGLHDGDVLDGLMVLHLPGHTPGHIGLQAGSVLFAGDTVSGGRRLRPAPRLLTWNEDLARRSLARMATLGVNLLLPGHGTPVDDGARRCAELVATK